MSSYVVVFFQMIGIQNEYQIIVLLLFVQTIASAFASIYQTASAVTGSSL